MAMTRRSTSKRVDYSKFGTSCSSSDDDDFENDISIPKKQKKEKRITQDKKIIKEKEIYKGRNKAIESKPVKKKGRKSRTSNAEQIYENELLVALEASKKTITEKENNHCKVVINVDSDEERIMKVIGSKKTTSGTESEGSAFADTMPINNKKLTTDSEHETTEKSDEDTKILYAEDVENDHCQVETVNLTPGINMNKDKRDDGVPFTKVSKITKKERREPFQENLNESTNDVKYEAQKKVASTSLSLSRSVSSNTKIPRLRLGLSRRTKVSKPLHQNVNFNVFS